MRRRSVHFLAVVAAVATGASVFAAKYDVAAYVWPAYHPCPRWAELGLFKDGKGEWQNLYEYKTRVEDGRPVAKPLWGYANEADPEVVARKIEAAAAAGVTVFIYDWYWYDGRPFLEEALNEGFLKASNCGRMKFYLMWANHNVTKIWDNTYGASDKTERVVWPSKVTDEDFRRIVRHWIDDYFKLPNYYRIDGKPVLMLYNVRQFIDWDGLDKAKERVAYLRSEAKNAGFPGVHLQVVARDDLPQDLGIDSLTLYNWTYRCPEMFPEKVEDEVDYETWGRLSLKNLDAARKLAEGLGIVFYPNLTCGWDTNARYPVTNRTPVVHNCNPASFERMAKSVRDWADRNLPPNAPRLITVNSWNEWTEGSYLEPDDRFGFGYLDALKRVFMSSSTRAGETRIEKQKVNKELP